MDNIVEPNLRHWVTLLGPPRVVGLCPTEHEPPVYGPYVLLLENRQMGDELGVKGSGHVLGAYNWPIKLYINPIVLFMASMLFLVHVVSQQG